MMPYILGLILFLLSQSVFAQQECFILTDLNQGKIIKEIGDCNTQASPGSSFKIPLSLMGFDSGILKTTTTPAWPYHDKYNAWVETQRQTLTPALWMKYSAVWYSQLLTTQLGEKKFKAYVNAFDYGNKNISGQAGKNNGLTHSWLEGGGLKISPKEQITFLSKMLKKQLGLTEKSYTYTKEILFEEKLSNGWKLYGKTGTIIEAGKQKAGWYVGWVSKGEDTWVFAHLISMPLDHVIKDPSLETEYAGPRARQLFINKFLALGI